MSAVTDERTSPAPNLPEGPVDLRLVAVDMDGTLLDEHGRPPVELPAVLDLLRERGITFVPASGRQYATLARMFGEAAAGMTFIAENGSVVVRDGEQVSSTVLDPALVARIVDGVRALTADGVDLGTVLCGTDRAWIERVDEPFLAEARTYYASLEVVDDLRAVDADVVKVAVFAVAGSDDATADAIRAAVGDGSARTVVSGRHWIDVMHPDADKGHALRVLQSELGVSHGQTAAFGDYLNDVGMLEAAGLSFAMANAHPEVREVARYAAPSNTEDGVVRTIRALLERADTD